MGLQLSRLERTPDKREVGSSSLLKPTKPDAIASGFLFIHSYQFSNSGGSKNSVWVFAFPCVPLFWIIAFIFNMMKNKKTNASTLVLINVLEGIRTPDPRLRRPLLYPTELQTHMAFSQAGDGNRTHVSSLEGWCSTIELHPRASCVPRTPQRI